MKKVTIIIPSYNRKKLLGECLVSVLRQDYPNKEIIVVDDGSTDNTLTYLNENFPTVKVIRNEINLGPAFAKNQGVINSSGEYLLFLDSDSELLAADTISCMVVTVSQDEHIGSVGGIAQVGSDGEVRRVSGKKVSFDGRSYSIALERKSINEFNAQLKECDYLETCNCFLRKEHLQKAGSFDPYYVYMGEDKELGMKLKSAGLKNLFGFKFALLHKYDEKVKYDRRFMYLKSRTRYVIKNKGICYFLLIPAIDLYMYAIYYPLLYCFKNAIPGVDKGIIFGERRNPNLRVPPVSWLLLAPYYFLKVYLLNLMDIPRTLSTREEYFLSELSMLNFKNTALKKSRKVLAS